MSDHNGDEPEEVVVSGIVPGGPLDCQDCGRSMGKQLVAGFMKQEDGITYVAAICPECMVDRLGLEWREMEKSSIVVPGVAPQGMRPS